APCPPATAPSAAPRPVETRVALVNLPMVIKKYKKFEVYEGELQRTLSPFQTEEAKLKKAYEDCQADINKPGANKEALENQMRGIKRQMEDLKINAQKAVGRKSDEQRVQLYKEVE